MPYKVSKVKCPFFNAEPCTLLLKRHNTGRSVFCDKCNDCHNATVKAVNVTMFFLDVFTTTIFFHTMCEKKLLL